MRQHKQLIGNLTSAALNDNDMVNICLPDNRRQQTGKQASNGAPLKRKKKLSIQTDRQKCKTI